MRVWFAAALATAGLQAGCGKTTTLACDQTIAQVCASFGGCLPTWDGGTLDPSFCGGLMPLEIDCGAYHALTVPSVNASRTSYYDAVSGMLVAIVEASSMSGSRCIAGPTGGFVLPTCPGAASEPVPQCLDGGTDAAAD